MARTDPQAEMARAAADPHVGGSVETSTALPGMRKVP